jgi:hypothetical protein
VRWNPYIELFAEVSRAVRATCKQCGVAIDKGDWRAKAIPVVGKPELLHLDCAAKRAPDLALRKVRDKAPDWDEEARERIARFLPEDATPSPRSYQRTPITDVSYAKEASGHRNCEYCGTPCPGEKGPTHGHGVRAFFLGGEYLFHPACVLQLAPGICRRVTVEDSEKNTAGIPKLEPAPSGRAACRYCKQKIAKGELRLAREQLYGMRRTPVYFHVACYCKSDDFHPKVLELVALRADKSIAREEIVALGDALPPTPEEDDDVPPLLDRMLALFDSIPRTADEAADGPESKLRENVVEIPKGFFTS